MKKNIQFLRHKAFHAGNVNLAFRAPDGNLDLTALTLDRTGIQAVSDMLFESKFVSAPYTEIVTIDTGIKNDQQIVISAEFNGLSGADRQNCDITPNSGKIVITEATWSPKKIADRHEECADNINADSFWKKFRKPGLKGYNLAGTEYEAYVLKRLMNYIPDDMMYRLFFLSNTSITAGGSNTLSSGQLKYFNRFNGYFSQLETIASAIPARKITITENAGSTYAAQAFATPSATVHPVEDYLAQVYAAAPLEVREAPDAQLLVSQTIFDQYRLERQAKTSIELPYTRLESGIKTLEYQGIRVVALPVIDRLLKRHFDNGTKVENPHFIVLIRKSNMRVGVEDEASMSQIEAKYSDFHKIWFAEYEMYLDPKIPIGKEVQFAR